MYHENLTAQTSGAPNVTPGQPRRGAIYVRMSQDREDAMLGIARQEEDRHPLCERKGWQVTRVYADNDMSAYTGKPRHGDAAAGADIMRNLRARSSELEAAYGGKLHYQFPREMEHSREACRLFDRRSGSSIDYKGEHDTYRNWFVDSQARLRMRWTASAGSLPSAVRCTRPEVPRPGCSVLTRGQPGQEAPAARPEPACSGLDGNVNLASAATAGSGYDKHHNPRATPSHSHALPLTRHDGPVKPSRRHTQPLPAARPWGRWLRGS